MEIKETASIYFSWGDSISEEDLERLGKWISKYMDGKIDIKKTDTEDGCEIIFIKTEG